MKHYVAEKSEAGSKVEVIDSKHPSGGYELDPRLDLRQHSPTGFSWGYNGSGPAQLSLALLADALEDDDLAQQFYQDSKFKVVSRLPEERWDLSQEDIRQSVAQLRSQRGRKLG